VVRNAERVPHVTFDDLAPVLRLLGTRHLGQNFGMHVVQVRLFSLSSVTFGYGELAPLNGHMAK